MTIDPDTDNGTGDGGEDSSTGNEITYDSRLDDYELSFRAHTLYHPQDGTRPDPVAGGLLARHNLCNDLNVKDEVKAVFQRVCDEELNESGGNYAGTFQARYSTGVAEEVYLAALNESSLLQIAKYAGVEVESELLDEYKDVIDVTYGDVTKILEDQRKLIASKDVDDEELKKQINDRLLPIEEVRKYSGLIQLMNELLDLRRDQEIIPKSSGIVSPGKRQKLVDKLKRVRPDIS